MPKMGVHHIHLTAACPVSFLIELTYEDIVYYSERENMFKVNPKGEEIEESFIRVNDLRKFWSSAEDFDNMLKNKIILT
jgi:hypothetical protein